MHRVKIHLHQFLVQSLMAALTIILPGVLSAVTVSAQTSSVSSPAPAARTDEAGNPYGSISGKVICDEGAVPFATITLMGNTRGRGNAFRSTTTDEEGNFRIDGLTPIAWNVSVSASGYVQETLPDETEQRFHRIGDTLTIRLVKGGIITGRVLNSFGEPMIAVRVSAQMMRDAQGRSASNASAIFQTDDRGVYRIYGLSPGAYVVMAGASGIFAGGGPGGGPGGPGFPGGPGNFPGISRNPYEGDAPTWYPSATRDTAVEVNVTGNSEVSGIDIQYRGGKGRAISGKITGAASESRGFGPGFGAGGAIVTLTHTATGAIVNRAFAMPRTDASVFAISGVADGEYEITAQRNGGGDDDAASLPRRITVTGRDISGLELTLLPMASVTGRLMMEAAATGNACQPGRRPQPEEIVLSLQREDNNDPRQGAAGIARLGFRGFTDEGARIFSPERMGDIGVRALTAGRYRIVPHLLDQTLYLRAITLPGNAATASAKVNARTAASATVLDAGATGINLKSGEKLKGLSVVAAEGAATVIGKIKTADVAFSQLRVYLVPMERADDVLRYAEASVAGDGTFSLRNLAPGKYKLFALRLSDKDNAEIPKAWNVTERTKLRRLADASTTILELSACQRVMNYELGVSAGR